MWLLRLLWPLETNTMITILTMVTKFMFTATAALGFLLKFSLSEAFMLTVKWNCEAQRLQLPSGSKLVHGTSYLRGKDSCIYIYIHRHIYIYIHIYITLCTIRVYMCTYIHIYIYIYTHTHTHFCAHTHIFTCMLYMHPLHSHVRVPKGRHGHGSADVDKLQTVDDGRSVKNLTDSVPVCAARVHRCFCQNHPCRCYLASGGRLHFRGVPCRGFLFWGRGGGRAAPMKRSKVSWAPLPYPSRKSHQDKRVRRSFGELRVS